MFYIKLTSFNNFSVAEEPVSRTGQLKQSLNSFYLTDSTLTGNY